MIIQRRSMNDASTSNQIIIGVVVGGFVFIALTAGIILFFHFRRKKQYRRKREQQLLPIYIPAAYKTDSLECPARVSFSVSLPRQSESLSQDMRIEPDEPPAYQPSFPVYDPSKYHGVDWPLPTQGFYKNGLGLSAPNPVHFPDTHRSLQPLAVDHRFSFQLQEGTEVLGLSSPSNRPAHTRQGSEPRGSTDRPRQPKPTLSLITSL